MLLESCLVFKGTEDQIVGGGKPEEVCIVKCPQIVYFWEEDAIKVESWEIVPRCCIGTRLLSDSL